MTTEETDLMDKVYNLELTGGEVATLLALVLKGINICGAKSQASNDTDELEQISKTLVRLGSLSCKLAQLTGETSYADFTTLNTTVQ